MTRYLPALDRRRHHRRRGGRIIIIDRPDRPTSIVAPNRNLRTTISPKRNVDVGQQPQRRRAGRCRSVGVRARWNRRRLRARAWGQREGLTLSPLSVLQNLAIVVDDPVPPCPRLAPAPSPARRPQREGLTLAPIARPPSSHRTGICEQQFRQKEMSTSASSRSAAEPAGAGRSASERAGIGAASRARVGAARRVNAALRPPGRRVEFQPSCRRGSRRGMLSRPRCPRVCVAQWIPLRCDAFRSGCLVA